MTEYQDVRGRDMDWREYEIAAMRRALNLAARGRGRVEPNPMVGAVLMRDGAVVGEGYHRKFGGAHAEADALSKAGEAARGSEAFVTLEPCSHVAKTPPCSEALIRAGVRRVVAAMQDPHEKVCGRGFRILREAGVKVEVGLLGEEAHRLNAAFVKRHTRGLPWIIAKYAMTADGGIATASGDSHWISCDASRRRVHRLRGIVDAVVVGVGTVMADDPLLTARPAGRRVATRVVLDSRGRMPTSSQLLATVAQAPVLVAVTQAAPEKAIEALRARGAEVAVMPGEDKVDVEALARELSRREMTNVLLEGGAMVTGSFLAAGLVDEVMAFVAPRLVGEGIGPVMGWRCETMRAAAILEDVEIERSDCDVLIRGRVRYRT